MDNILTENLSEELVSNESLSKFNDVNGLAKSYLEVESKIGSMTQEHETQLSKMVELPGEDADENARRTFATKLGCPEKPEGYSDISIEGVPKDEQDSETVKLIKGVCHKVGVSDEQYKAVMEQVVKQQLVSLDAFVKQDKAAEDKAVSDLTHEWGGETKYKEKVELGRRLVKHYGGEDNPIAEFLIDTRLGNFAPLVKLLGNIASDIIGEESTFTGETKVKDKTAEVELSPTTGEPMLKYDKSPELK